MADEFNTGDVVQLKSGGPLMTIESVKNNDTSGRPTVYCTWFEKDEQKRGHFPLVGVETYEPHI